MSKLSKGFLCVIFAIFLIAVITAVCNFKNLKVFFISQRYSSTAEINDKIEKNKEDTDEILKQLNQTELTTLTDEQQEKLTVGEISEQEAVEIILSATGQNIENKDTTGNKDNQVTHKAEGIQENKNDYEDKLSNLIAKIYVLKAKYNGLIKRQEKAVIDDFFSLPKEKQTKAAKYKIAGAGLKNVLKLQEQCDGEINSVLTDMEKLLKENGQKLDIIEQIKKAYENEKELTKAYYINKYTKNKDGE